MTSGPKETASVTDSASARHHSGELTSRMTDMNQQATGVICFAASILSVLTLLTGQSRASVPKKTTVALTVTSPLDADAGHEPPPLSTEPR